MSDQRPKIVRDGEFTIVEVISRRRPLWVSAVIGGIRAFHGLRLLITIALLLIAVAAIATDGAATRAIHTWLYGS